MAVPQWGSVFLSRASRGATVLRELLGESDKAVPTSDRAKAYPLPPLHKRQLCWAHRQRDFQARGDRGGPAGEVGRRLLLQAEIVFGWWHWGREGEWKRATFRRRLPGLRRSLRAAWEQGTWSPGDQTAATCREVRRGEPALWTFVREEGVDPTNNAAERALRHAVQWRKTSYGTDRAGGSRFGENIVTAVTTWRQQKRNVLAYLTAWCQARYAGTPPPSLLPQSVR